MAGEVVLGGIVFTDWQVPERMPFGGKQTLAVKKLVGGQRVIDALGPDDADIRWTGRFRGAGALANAQALDAMRAAGRQLTLTAIGLIRIVVIEEFTFTPEKPYEIPYSITCVVAQNPMQGVLAAVAASLDALVGSDLSAIQGLIQ